MLLNLKLFRIKKNLTQSALAKKIGVTQQTYSKWETGKNNPNSENIQKIAKVLEVPIFSLFI
ncbi:helix-turn-helix transcriptional regulator [Globicatella sulfidifaciens]